MEQSYPLRSENSHIVLNDQIKTVNSSDRNDQAQREQIEDCIRVDLHNESNPSITDKASRVGLLSRSNFNNLTLKLISAFFYGMCSFIITIINKIVLTTYGFPSSNILGLGQMVAILLVLRISSLFRLVVIRRVSIRNRKIWTLAIFYVGNLVSSLGGTKHLPLPMFIALRRLSIVMTAIGEYCFLNVRQSPYIIMTILAMIGGSFIAAAADLTFNALGYTLVMISGFFTAANGVYTKKTIDAREINKHEILYYNALFTILPLIVISYFTNNVEKLTSFEYWSDAGFIISFLSSCFMGYLLMFSTVLCTHYNSALTTTIVGTLKNILTTYVGMYVGGDYRFSTLNFIGLNVSLVGSLVYSYLTFSPNKMPIKEQPK